MPFFAAQSIPSPSDAAVFEMHWVSRCRLGDQDALANLISKHRARLIRTASNLLRDPHEAEDVSQEAFIKAFREIGKLRDDRAFGGFLYRICVRLCMDRLRLKKFDTTELDLTSTHQSDEIEDRLLVEKLLKCLPIELRTTLVLRELEQLSYEEIALAMKVPVGTVRSRLHAARIKFRTLWMSEEGEA